MIENMYAISDTEMADKIQKAFQKQNGTYVLHWFDRNSPRQIHRLGGTDKEGILYIGETESTLAKRISLLKQAIDENSDPSQKEPRIIGHATLGAKFYRIRRLIHIDDLYVAVHPAIISPKEDESKRLEEYVSNFGELPPLNGIYGSHAHWKLFH